ncbi:MAG TPA: 2-oxoglutarate dehydrogenase complex dihydrolipoyllysine-residue succinyltransferase [Phycisphaerales bacterium]|nr:2-oxoglutarate dehydrogenase complex dihydrolipoyllysine-residue succinyltransferase [Phycisphaerales bacterium]
MATEIVIPNVGESVTSGVISAWRKKDGDYVDRDEPVLDLETDKITMEITAPASGVLKRLAGEGDEVPVGAVVGSVDESGTRAGAPGSGEARAQTGAQPSAPASRAEPPKAPETPAPALATPPPAAARAEDVRATPLAERIAKERNVDLSRVVGTGAGGRIREHDVLAYVQSQNGPGGQGAPAAQAPQPAQARPAQAPAGARAVSLKKMTPLRQRVAARLVEAQHTAAMLTTFNECDMTAVMSLRKRYKEPFEKKHGVGLGFMSFFVKAATGALRASPMVNGYIVTDEGGQLAIETHDYCDVAIAVAGPKGLVVPVIRNAETLSFAEIELAVKDLATRAKDGKLDLSDLQGGTFTITNGGIFGSLQSTPILNPPQSAILGMHAIKNRPVEHPERPGEIALRPMMYLALSYDHRIIDGAEAVTFLVNIKNAIESPERLMLDL